MILFKPLLLSAYRDNKKTLRTPNLFRRWTILPLAPETTSTRFLAVCFELVITWHQLINFGKLFLKNPWVFIERIPFYGFHSTRLFIENRPPTLSSMPGVNLWRHFSASGFVNHIWKLLFCQLFSPIKNMPPPKVDRVISSQLAVFRIAGHKHVLRQRFPWIEKRSWPAFDEFAIIR